MVFFNEVLVFDYKKVRITTTGDYAWENTCQHLKLLKRRMILESTFEELKNWNVSKIYACANLPPKKTVIEI